MSSGDLLPFESRFLDWLDRTGATVDRFKLRCDSPRQEMSAYRFRPRGGGRRVLVALHGAGNDALFGWLALFKRQLARGSEIVTFDLPGHGRADRTVFSGESALAAVASASEFAASDGLPVHAVGVSLGGSVLLGALPSVQHRLASAAAVVAPLRIVLSPATLVAELRPANLLLLWREREHYGFTGLVPSFGPFKREIYPLRLARPAPAGAFGYVEALNDVLLGMDLPRAAAAADIPLLLAYGERDRVVPIEQGERIAQVAPRAELMRVPGGTHLSTPMEPALADRLDRWLEQRPCGAA